MHPEDVARGRCKKHCREVDASLMLENHETLLGRVHEAGVCNYETRVSDIHHSADRHCWSPKEHRKGGCKGSAGAVLFGILWCPLSVRRLWIYCRKSKHAVFATQNGAVQAVSASSYPLDLSIMLLWRLAICETLKLKCSACVSLFISYSVNAGEEGAELEGGHKTIVDRQGGNIGRGKKREPLQIPRHSDSIQLPVYHQTRSKARGSDTRYRYCWES